MRPLRTEPRSFACGSARWSLLAAGIAVGAWFAPTVAMPGARVVEDLRPLLVEAIDAVDGAARGVLAGPASEVLRRRGVSSDPLEVEVTTLKVYRQPGCRRLNVRFAQRAVRLGEAPPQDRLMAFQLNYCRNGEPPRSLE
ncbi:MAG: hypothetical protein ACREKH_07405 [Candidatus Rokuibacteriota bacterium]